MRIIYYVLLLLCFFASSGCNPESEETLRNLQGGLEKGLESAQQTIESLGPEKSDTTAAAIDEVEKLFRFEYRIFRLNKADGSSLMEMELSRLGEQRWDCFHIIDHETELEFFCKRRPKSYLRYFKAL